MTPQTKSDLKNLIITVLIICVVLAGTMGWVYGASDGYTRGEQDFMQARCTYYPFLLLDPAKWVACEKP